MEHRMTASTPSGEPNQTAESTPNTEAADAGATLAAQIEALQAELTQLREDTLRERAELENQRKRMAREVDMARKFANERLLAELLPVIDSLEAGLAVQGDTAAHLREGMELTLRQLLKVASDQAERVITAGPLAWYRPDRDAMGAENHADLVAAISRTETVRAMLEDYRAGLRVDRTHDEQDRAAGRRITCPTLVAWSKHDDMETLYGDPAAVWAPWCADPVTTAVIDSGHHMAEEAPEQLADVLGRFLAIS